MQIKKSDKELLDKLAVDNSLKIEQLILDSMGDVQLSSDDYGYLQDAYSYLEKQTVKALKE